MKVIVTGISSGIGKALVVHYLKMGYECVGITRSIQSIDQAYLSHENFKAIEWGDISVEQMVKQNTGLLSDAAILINNAATIIVKPFIDTQDKDLADIYQTNLIKPFALIRSIYRTNMFCKNAHIVNISSMGGYQGAAKFPGLSAYSISKAALVAMTESLSVELKEVSINCLCLGAVQTDMLKRAFPDYQSQISDVSMAKFIADFSISDANLISGCVIPVKKTDPN